MKGDELRAILTFIQRSGNAALDLAAKPGQSVVVESLNGGNSVHTTIDSILQDMVREASDAEAKIPVRVYAEQA